MRKKPKSKPITVTNRWYKSIDLGIQENSSLLVKY